MNAPFSGIIFLSLFCDSSYSAINKADILPEKFIYSPVLESLENIPSLSASGSFANTTSASTFLANSKANLKAFGSSGFG